MNEQVPVWRTCLDVESQDESRYVDHVNEGLLTVIDGAPRRALDLGCSKGAFGAMLKQRYPGIHVTGIEAGRVPAAIAAQRLDRVVCERLENIDLAAHGLAHGEFDLVVAGDILEHVVNPWDLLVRIKPFLAARAQVVASIPNVRNMLLVAALAVNGRWEYRERGLLDITHLRFFTLEEIRRMFAETGYQVEGYTGSIARPLEQLFARNQGREKVTLQFGRLTLADVTPPELFEMCAEQFLVRARSA